MQTRSGSTLFVSKKLSDLGQHCLSVRSCLIWVYTDRKALLSQILNNALELMCSLFSIFQMTKHYLKCILSIHFCMLSFDCLKQIKLHFTSLYEPGHEKIPYEDSYELAVEYIPRQQFMISQATILNTEDSDRFI